MQRLIICLSALMIAVTAADTVTISTSVGLINGTVLASGDKKLYAFYSLRYAQPPVGELRFLPPRPITGHEPDHQVDATTKPPSCLQWTYRNSRGLSTEPLSGDEDCLFLNVYVPEKTLLSSNKLPVMVWIHGGGFLGGSGDPDFYGPHHLMETEKVVVVTLNYRLGALGWMSLGDDVVPGNMGQKDQVMALRWVKENIGSFGGDAERVTIFGESAGGISVMFHLLSPASAGLFHKAISQSGPVLDMSPLHLSKHPGHYGRKFAEAAGCSDKDSSSEAVLQCLQSKSVAELLKATKMFEQFQFVPNPWKPIVDWYASEPYLGEDPKKVMEEGRHNQVPLMVGGTADEGCLYMTQFLMHPERFAEVEGNFAQLGPMLFLGTDGEDATEVESKVARDFLEKYLGKGAEFRMDNQKGLSNLLTDLIFLAPIHVGVKVLQKSSRQPVYYYNYRYRGSFTLPSLYGYDQRSGDLGVCHGDDLFVLFKTAIPKTADDLAMARKMAALWVNFASTGVPAGQNWSAVGGSGDASFAILDSGEVRMAAASEEFESRMAFAAEKFDLLRKDRMKSSRHEEL